MYLKVNKIALALKRLVFGAVDDGTHPVVISGSGVPAVVEATGSLFLRDNAPNADNLAYVRQGGLWTPLSTAGGGSAFPVLDTVFLVENAVNITKQLNMDLSGQAPGTTTTLFTTAAISRPFRLPNISGTAVVQEDVTGFVLLGSDVPLFGSAGRVQLNSIVANGAQFRANQFGANAGVPGVSTFKSRGAAVGSLAGVIAGDVIFGDTCVGVAPDNVSIPLAGLIRIQVPLAFVPVAQNWVPSEYELQLVALTGPINGRRAVFKVSSEGEVQSLFLQPARPPATDAGYATYAILGDAFPLSKVAGDATGGLLRMGPGGAVAPDTRVRRVAPSGGVPQVVVDDNAAGAVNVIPAVDQISKLGTRSAADGGSDPVSVRWAEVNAVAVNTGDLNLIDKEKDAHWTIVEERDRILVVNQKTGKRYAMAMTPIDDE